MLKDLASFCLEEMSRLPFSNLSVSRIDFRESSYESFQIENGEFLPVDTPVYFDLASLTKPLTLASARLLHPNLFSDKENLLLNHQAGLPAWGRLSTSSWEEQILSYKIGKTKTLYSDFSALRLMLELEKSSGQKLHELVNSFWDKELMFWKNLPDGFHSVVTGMRRGSEIYGEVHDDNAYVIGKECSHAGLFGTVSGVSKSLINLQKQSSFLEVIKKDIEKLRSDDLYVMGWDRVLDKSKTLAGIGATSSTFGHTGFTGTSIWIEPSSMKGTLILSNFCSASWFDRDSFNRFRKSIGIL